MTPIVGQLDSNFQMKDLAVNKQEVDKVFVASFRHLSDPRVTGYTQFRIKDTAGFHTKSSCLLRCDHIMLNVRLLTTCSPPPHFNF